jgi:hypothetical protein
MALFAAPSWEHHPGSYQHQKQPTRQLMQCLRRQMQKQLASIMGASTPALPKR